MCLSIYAASDAPIGLVPWEEDAVFSITPAEDRLGVAQRLGYAAAVEVGAYTGCGCGFEYPVYDDRAEDAWESSVEALVAWLETVTAVAPVDALVCWKGSEESEASELQVVAPDDLFDLDFNAASRQPLLLRIQASPHDDGQGIGVTS